MDIAANTGTALRLMYDTKKFNNIYNRRKYANSDLKPAAYALNIGGAERHIKMRLLNGDINMFYEVLWSAIYALPESRISQPAYIVDLGANVGFASLYFADKYPDAQITAVEPSRRNFDLLQHNTASFANIATVHAAIYPTAGEVPFFDDDLAYNSRIGDKDHKSYMVRAITVPELMTEQSIPAIDLLKLDIEGAEQLLLSSNTEWLHKVGFIIVELHKPYTIADFRNHLAPYGFSVLSPEDTGLEMIIATKNG